MEGRIRKTGTGRVHLANGSTILMDAGPHSDSHTNHLFWHGADSYEPEVLQVLLSLSKDAAVVLDVGANVGIYTLLVAENNPETRIFAFEPVSDVFERLTRNVLLNNLSKVVCVQAAVSSARGQIPIYSPIGRTDTIASSSIDHRVKTAPGPWRCDLANAISLDDFATEAGLRHIDVVKIDVEHQEHTVIEGMQKVMTKSHPHIFAEVLPHGEGGMDIGARIDQLLRPHGYNFYLLRKEGPLFRESVHGDYHDWNHLFTVLDPIALAAALVGSGLTVSP